MESLDRLAQGADLSWGRGIVSAAMNQATTITEMLASQDMAYIIVSHIKLIQGEIINVWSSFGTYQHSSPATIRLEMTTTLSCVVVYYTVPSGLYVLSVDLGVPRGPSRNAYGKMEL